MPEPMPRQPEPELMDLQAEADAYARADFADVNQAFADRLVALAGHLERARAVDLGTGPGDIPVRLARAMPGWHITAVDASEPNDYRLVNILMHERARGLMDRVDWYFIE